MFKKMFRLDCTAIHELVCKNQSFLKEDDEGKTRNSSGLPTLVTTRVTVTLHQLAGASTQNFVLLGIYLVALFATEEVCCPYANDVLRPKYYRFCKRGFANIVLAGTEIYGQFICATACYSGSTNDIKVWKECSLYQYLEIQKGLPERYFFIQNERIPRCLNS